MSSSTAVVLFVPQAQKMELVQETVKMLVTTKVDMIEKKAFMRILTQGSDPAITLEEIVTALAKSKKTDDHDKIAARIQTMISETRLKGFNVQAHMENVWTQQQAAYDALTPEELAAYNALSPEELAEHVF
jgi:hypothetical protein